MLVGGKKLVLFLSAMEELTVYFLKFKVIWTGTGISYVPLYKAKTCFVKKPQVCVVSC